MFQKVFNRRHNLRDARLVVRAKQRVAVRVDYRTALLLRQSRFLRRIQFKPLCKRDLSSVVLFHQLRLNILSGNIACRVQMGKETDRGRSLFALARRNPGYHITVGAQLDFFYTKPQKLVLQCPRQIPLARA